MKIVLASNQRRFLAEGRYVLDAPIRVPIMATLEGAGRGTSLVAAGDFPCVELEGSYASVKHLSLDAVTNSTGTGIDCTEGESNNTIDDIWFDRRLKIGLQITPYRPSAGIYRIQNLRFDAVDGMTWGIIIGDGQHLVSDLMFSNISLTTLGGMVGAVAIRNRVDTVSFSQSTFVAFDSAPTGMSIGVPDAQFDVTGVQLNDVIFDGFAMAGLQALKVSSLRVVGGSYNMNPILLHAGVRGALLLGATIQAAPAYAVYIDRARAVRLVGNLIADNNTKNWVGPAAKPVYVTAGTSPPRLSGNDFGNDILWANTGHQAFMDNS
jgi:hypothetical protein